MRICDGAGGDAFLGHEFYRIGDLKNSMIHIPNIVALKWEEYHWLRLLLVYFRQHSSFSLFAGLAHPRRFLTALYWYYPEDFPRNKPELNKGERMMPRMWYIRNYEAEMVWAMLMMELLEGLWPFDSYRTSPYNNLM